MFFVFFLLHPLTAAAGHHPGSSSFASQPEHSDRGRPARIVHGQGRVFFSPLSLYSMENSGPTGKFARDRPEFALLLAFCCGCPFSSPSHTHSHAVFTLTEEEKKVLHTRTHTHTFFVQLCSVREENSTFSTPRGKSQFSAVPRRFTPSRRHSRIAPGNMAGRIRTAEPRI